MAKKKRTRKKKDVITKPAEEMFEELAEEIAEEQDDVELAKVVKERLDDPEEVEVELSEIIEDRFDELEEAFQNGAELMKEERDKEIISEIISLSDKIDFADKVDKMFLEDMELRLIVKEAKKLLPEFDNKKYNEYMNTHKFYSDVDKVMAIWESQKT